MSLFDRFGNCLVMILLIALICLAVAATAALLTPRGDDGLSHPRVIWDRPGEGVIVVDLHAAHRVGGRTYLQVRTAQGTWHLAPVGEVRTNGQAGPESAAPASPNP